MSDDAASSVTGRSQWASKDQSTPGTPRATSNSARNKRHRHWNCLNLVFWFCTILSMVVFCLERLDYLNRTPLSISLTGKLRGRGPPIDRWLDDESAFATKRILLNIGPRAGAADGLVIASPSKGESEDVPDYFYTWTRDSALTISTLMRPFLREFTSALNATDTKAVVRDLESTDDVLYETLLRAYIASQADFQLVPNPSGGLYDGGLNEPKFQVDGNAFIGDWGRPQRDGPALRALTLMPYANLLLDRDLPLDKEYIADHLFSSEHVKYPGRAIKNDLEEVAHGWWKGGFDLWEEINGHHLFTLAASMRALQAGAELAARLNDTGAATYYGGQAQAVSLTINSFWDEEKGYWQSSIGYDRLSRRLDHRSESPQRNERQSLDLPERDWLDCSLPLTLIHAGPDRPVIRHQSENQDQSGTSLSLSPTHPTVLTSLHRYVLSFEGLYEINRGRRWTRGWALGRYREDVYDGVGQSQGNPWYICTYSLAHTFYLAQKAFLEQGEIEIHNLTLAFWQEILSTSHPRRAVQAGEVWYKGQKRFKRAIEALGDVGDNFVRAGRRWSESGNGRMSEQIGRDDGQPKGARDLTWSYASLVEVARARKEARHLATRQIFN